MTIDKEKLAQLRAEADAEIAVMGPEARLEYALGAVRALQDNVLLLSQGLNSALRLVGDLADEVRRSRA